MTTRKHVERKVGNQAITNAWYLQFQEFLPIPVVHTCGSSTSQELEPELVITLAYFITRDYSYPGS